MNLTVETGDSVQEQTTVSEIPHSLLRAHEHLIGRFEESTELLVADAVTSVALDVVNGSNPPPFDKLVEMFHLHELTQLPNRIESTWYDERNKESIIDTYCDYSAIRRIETSNNELNLVTGRLRDAKQNPLRAVRATWSLPDEIEGKRAFTRCVIDDRPGDIWHPENTHLKTLFDVFDNHYTLSFDLHGYPFGTEGKEFNNGSLLVQYSLDGALLRNTSSF